MLKNMDFYSSYVKTGKRAGYLSGITCRKTGYFALVILSYITSIERSSNNVKGRNF